MSLRTLSLVLILLARPALAEPIDSADVHIVDGDTIRVYHQQPNVRLVGFNAPETWRAQCESESQLGAKATRRLRELVRGGGLDFEYVRPC
jgi:endonuclease YncB( thermonuclease family)